MHIGNHGQFGQIIHCCVTSANYTKLLTSLDFTLVITLVFTLVITLVSPLLVYLFFHGFLCNYFPVATSWGAHSL